MKLRSQAHPSLLWSINRRSGAGLLIGQAIQRPHEQLAVRRSPSELTREFTKIDPVARLELALSNVVLLEVVIAAEAHSPAIRGFERKPAISPAADMGTFYRALQAATYRTMVPPNPGSMGRAVSPVSATFSAFKPLRQADSKHQRSPVTACGDGLGWSIARIPDRPLVSAAQAARV